MAQAQQSAGVDPAFCVNAEEYVLDRLDRSDTPLSPSELADEYGCTGIHMRGVMSQLAQDDEIERVSRGQYVAARDDQEGTTNEDTPVLHGSTGVTELDEIEEQGDETDAEQSDSMPTDDEYERQHADQGDGTDAVEDEPVGSDNDGRDDQTGTQAETTDVPAFVGGVDPRTLMLVVAVAAVGYVAYRSVSGSGTSPDQAGSDDGEQVEQIADVDGGLLG